MKFCSRGSSLALFFCYNIKVGKKMCNKYKNIIYFQNGSIGDFLMSIFLLENIYLNDSSVKFNIVIPKNLSFLSQVVSSYPYINLIYANKKFSGIIGVLKIFKFIFSRNLVLVPPTPGEIPLVIKMIARLISLFPGSVLVGFEDRGKIHSNIFSKTLRYNIDINYSEHIKNILRELDYEIKLESPIIKYQKEESVTVGNYVVLHPKASTFGRTLSKEEVFGIIKIILEKDSSVKVFLTGGKDDQSFLEMIYSHFSDKVKIFINSGFSDLCRLVEYSKYYIGVDTGTTHIASFLKKKSFIIARKGTPNWLPYYNDNSKIIYYISGCQHKIFEGEKHLFDCIKDKERPGILLEVPMDIILSKFRIFLENV